MGTVSPISPTNKDTDDGESKLGSADVITDAKAYLQLCEAADGESREASLDDLTFLSGDQWPDMVQRQREMDKRPCLTVNKLPTFLHQVTNDQRQNVPSIKVSPVGEADEETAEIFQGLIRHIEYSSNADIAYDTAVNSAAAIGFGFFRLVTDYCEDGSFDDQEIRFQRFRNPFTVYFDPMSQEPDGSDAKKCGIAIRMPRSDFTKAYPGADVPGANGFAAATGDTTTKDWWGADFVRVMEFYRIEETAATKILLSNGEVGYKEDLLAMPAGVSIAKERPCTRKKTMWYKLTALEVLEKTEIKCPWIPVFPVYGDEIDLDGKVIRSGIIRNAKEPAQMYNFWMTAATEEVALRQKTPYIGAEGQFEGYEDDWNAANTTSFAYLEYKPVTLDGQMAPAPIRQPMADIPNGMLTMAMHANDNIKATTGLFDSSLGALGNARSGTQERSQQRQGDMANFHFTDNLNRSVRHCARCMVKMIQAYYAAPRTLRIMGDDDSIKSVQVNTPAPPQPVQPMPPQGQPMAPQPGAPPMQPLSAVGQQPGQPPQVSPADQVGKILNDLTVGDYDIVVKAGPNYSTMREEAAEGMTELAKAWPKLMDVAGDKVVRAMDWPGAAEMADRIAKTLPPGLADEDQDPDAPTVQTAKGPIPVDQAGQMIMQMDQQIQAMAHELQEAKAGIPAAQVKAGADTDQTKIKAASDDHRAQIQSDTAIEVAKINAGARNDVAELTGMVQLLVAKLNAPPEMAADVEKEVEAPSAEPAPDYAKALLEKLVEAHTTAAAAPPGKPGKKRISIQAPSGAVYHGEIAEDEAP